jgi:cell fate (sporulation/competence/biofilm development) regulator YlbF (YheA/YmcA/DUF963 family)
MAGLMEMAKDLGSAMARTDEYQALRRAMEAAGDDRDLAELRSEMDKLEAKVANVIRSGTEPPAELVEEYNAAFSRLEANSGYQKLVAAQTNFEKVLQRVNETITRSLEETGTSRIIIPSS